jgi:lysophospholipase L1-like esterase
MHGKIKLSANQTVVFIGDSITDADKNMPAYQPFGFGYVHFVAYMLLAKYPQLNISVINTGINGDSINDLEQRWEQDCISYKPDILSVLIGINDAYRMYTSPAVKRGLYPEEYELTYRRLLLRAREECKSQIVLMEPFMFCSDCEEQMFRFLQEYIQKVHILVREFGAVLVPLQERINEQIQQVTAEKWSQDMVHPYVWAHAWIAQRWLEATGL